MITIQQIPLEKIRGRRILVLIDPNILSLFGDAASNVVGGQQLPAVEALRAVPDSSVGTFVNKQVAEKST